MLPDVWKPNGYRMVMTKKIDESDLVRTPEGRYGIVKKIDGETVHVDLFDESCYIWESDFKKNDLTVIDERPITVGKLKSFVRFETELDDILPERIPKKHGYQLPDDEYLVTLEDAEAALCNMRSANATAERFWAWHSGWNWYFEECYVWDMDLDPEFVPDINNMKSAPADRRDLLKKLDLSWWYVAKEYSYGNIPPDSTDYYDFDLALRDIAAAKAGETSGIKPYRWSTATKQEYALSLGEGDLASMSEDELVECLSILEGMIVEDDPDFQEIVNRHNTAVEDMLRKRRTAE